MAYDFRLLDWKQTARVVGNGHHEQRVFIGANPLLIQAPKQFVVLVQTGYAVGLDAMVVAPSPLFPTMLFAPPEVTVERMDDWRVKTSWSYTMVVDDTATAHAAVALMGGTPEAGNVSFGAAPI